MPEHAVGDVKRFQMHKAEAAKMREYSPFFDKYLYLSCMQQLLCYHNKKKCEGQKAKSLSHFFNQSYVCNSTLPST